MKNGSYHWQMGNLMETITGHEKTKTNKKQNHQKQMLLRNENKSILEAYWAFNTYGGRVVP
jgi:hypothetical protein